MQTFLKGHFRPEALTNKLPPECLITALPHGVAVQSGTHPVLGDRNESEDGLPWLRRTYSVLQPLQFVDPGIPFDEVYSGSDQTLKWLTRLGQAE